MTDDLARETARRVLDAAVKHGDAEAGVRIISEALAAERERCFEIVANWPAWDSPKLRFELGKIAAAIREEPHHD